jgi:5-formyltetrahydrofolate cyclo-ligase
MDSSLLTIQEAKRVIRRTMVERRSRLPVEERVRLTNLATQRFLDLGELCDAKIVAGFVATRSEIDAESVLTALRQRGLEIVLPRVATLRAPSRLRFHRYTHRAELTPGSFGLLEPTPKMSEVPAHVIDVFIVPGLAFDQHGMRVGYGGGYYDECAAYVRAHPNAGKALFIGFAFDFQLLESCPAAEWDVPSDYIITDARTICCSKGDN